MPTREQRARRLGVPVDQLPDGRGKNPNSWHNTKRGDAHHRWNDGRMLSDDGYVKVRVGTEHPLADANGYAYEHLVVWCAAGNPRPGPGELLHHKNENKADNRYANLELKPRADHSREHTAERQRDSLGRLLPHAAGRHLGGRTHDEFPEAR
ncbi:HNH endonuclease [Burkholderia cenocepacia]|uniref:HNH endonuclease n=1 Tax=Burkholderia cenocepacia TaxID=95486 RepID=UPI002ABE982B|nr:HNH endonuclease [Burkholderia cenocepacia]